MLARSVTLNVLGNIGSLVVGIFGAIVLARWLGPSDRGLLGIMLSIVDLAMAVGSFGIPFAVLYYASRPDAQTRELLGNSLVVGSVLGIVVVAAALLLTQPLADLFGRGRGGQDWALAAALVPLTFFDYTSHNQLLGKLHFARFNILAIASKTSFVAGVIGFVGIGGLGVAGGLLATACGSLVYIVGSLAVILRAGRPRFDPGLLRKLLNYGTRVQLGSIFQLANMRLDVLILGFFAPLSSVGYYVVAQSVAELVLMLGRSFQSSVLPLVAHYEGEERQAHTTETSLRHHGLIGAVATLGNAVAGSLLIAFAYGPDYRAAILPLLILLPGVWFLSTGTVVGGDLRGRGRPGLSSALAGLAVIVTVVLDVVLIPPYGVAGAALASLAAYTVYGVSSLIALTKVAAIPMRRLTVPTRADLAVYGAAVRRGRGALQRRRMRSS